LASIEFFSFVILYTSPLIVLGCWFFKRGNTVRIVNPLSFLVILFFIRNHLGLAALYFNEDGFKQLAYVDRAVVLNIALVNCIFLVFAFLTLESHLGKAFAKFVEARSSGISYHLGNTTYLCLLLLGGVIWVFSYARFSSGSALLLLLETGSHSAALDARKLLYEQGQVFGMRLQYLNTIFIFFELVFVHLLWLAVKYSNRRYVFIASFYFLGMALWHLSNTSKGYSIIVLFYLFIMFSMVHGSRYITGKSIYLVIVGIIISAPLAYFVMGNQSLYILYPLERFLVGNLLPQYIIFSYFEWDTLLLGASVPSWYSFGNHEQFLLAEWNWRFMNDKMNSILAYNNPSSFVAELYANFGYFSVFMYPVVFLYIGAITVVILRFFPRYFGPSLVAFLSVYYSKYSVKEFLPTILDYRLFLVFFVLTLVIAVGFAFNNIFKKYS
jgi:hypothetical protein